MTDLFELIRNARVYDLAQPLYAGVPHFPTHAPFLYTLNKVHGEVINQGGSSAASETFAMGAHTGTHMDGLNHFSCGGQLFGGHAPRQSFTGGVEPHSIDTVAPVLRRGVLFDVAGHEGVDALPHDYTVTPEVLEAIAAKHSITLGKGDVALLRTGWARYWDDPKQFITGGLGGAPTGPGPRRAGAEWLSRHGIFAAGSDTVGFEQMPSPAMEGHVHLLVESGIHIIEVLNLEELARDDVREFLFIALPLKIRGGTGSPIRPVAIKTK